MTKKLFILLMGISLASCDIICPPEDSKESTDSTTTKNSQIRTSR
ncbi:hypothetical protein [Dyadobacter sp. LHD-138]|nr:hypothetical protein [Dyadobacter sp. LHD-138]MDQ6478114.1 hypothetical protein [Dyadobacter sp. LHD-138]